MLKPRKLRNHFYTNYVEVNLYDNVYSCKNSYSVIADISPDISEENYSLRLMDFNLSVSSGNYTDSMLCESKPSNTIKQIPVEPR